MDANKFDYKSLSIKKQYVWKLCKQILHDLKNGECSEEDIDQFIASTDAKQHGYINPDDYMTADRAMISLGVHRNQFFALAKEYSITCKKINGHSIGYHKNDIAILKQGILQKK